MLLVIEKNEFIGCGNDEYDWIMKQNQGYYSNNRDMPSKLQEKAKFLCWKYNQTSPLEKDKRQSLLQALFGECHPLTFIEHHFDVITGSIFILMA